ncbi:MAG: ABC transporter ATP-binding protein [Gammaproteobacteria bacterium]|nr:ABC transporter ATP-binding protein [Gammaproteobacteria bacterium]
MNALSIQNLKKIYKNGFTALKGIDLTVPAGDFFALLGPNGAGKTTLIGIISHLITKSAGRVAVFDYDLDKQLAQAKANIGLVPQEFNFSIFETVEQIVINQAGYYGIPRDIAKMRAKKYLTQLDLWSKRHSQARLLSGGMKRRLMIARALMHEPRLLILDEPTAGVDIEVRRSMWRFLKEINQNGTTIILTTHYLEEAETLCKNIAIINQGTIIENTSMSNLLTKLNIETFVLFLKEAIQDAPQLSGYSLRKVDSKTLEADVNAGQGVNDLFCLLRDQGIEVLSMKNKANRLEEMFISIVGEDIRES